MEINKIYNENCIDTMQRMPDNFLDLTVTSPPYDNLRNYNGYKFDFESIAKELYRTTKEGGVVVWIVADATIKGSETGTSFRQALYFMECGFNLHDTMIWQKHSPYPSNVRYNQEFEYMFIFSKSKPKVFNPVKVNKSPNTLKRWRGATSAKKTQIIKEKGKDKRVYFGAKAEERFLKSVNKTKKTASNVWYIPSGNINGDKIAFQHPAIFPEKLANDHIISWSNPDDLVYDCFTGSGTTWKMCLRNDRNFIGSEISEEYMKIATQRIEETKKIIALEKTQLKLF